MIIIIIIIRPKGTVRRRRKSHSAVGTKHGIARA